MQLAAALPFALGLMEKTAFKQRFYRFMAAVPCMEKTVEDFWDTHEGGIMAWYLAQRQKEDVIISASPEFLLAPLCRRMGIAHLMASRVDPATGTYSGINCHGREKVRRFRECFPEAVIDRFYSDSLSDSPLADIAKESFMVRGNQLLPWPKDKTK